MAKDRTKRGGARPGSGPKKKEGYRYIMIPVSDQILIDNARINVVNFAEKAVFKRFFKKSEE